MRRLLSDTDGDRLDDFNDVTGDGPLPLHAWSAPLMRRGASIWEAVHSAAVCAAPVRWNLVWDELQTDLDQRRNARVEFVVDCARALCDLQPLVGLVHAFLQYRQKPLDID